MVFAAVKCGFEKKRGKNGLSLFAVAEQLYLACFVGRALLNPEIGEVLTHHHTPPPHQQVALHVLCHHSFPSLPATIVIHKSSGASKEEAPELVK